MTISAAKARLKADLGIIDDIPPKKVIPKPVANETQQKPAPKPMPVTELCPEDRLRIGIDAVTNAAQYGDDEIQHKAAVILLDFAERLLYA